MIWRGEKIVRVIPVATSDGSSYSFSSTENAPTLISASKYHIVIEYGRKPVRRIFDSRYAKYDDWKKLVEE